MSRLSELINELCPEGVEYKKLGEICDIIRGVRVTKKDLLEDGKYPVVSGGTGYMGYINDYNREAETITIAQYGTAGYIKWQIQKFWANDICFCVLPNKEIIVNKYLYYFLANKQEYIYSLSNREAVPYSIDKDKILNIQIPVPPLPVQEEIVRILDTFTSLEAELEAELEARKQQYEYYRNKLLKFDDSVERKKLENLGFFYGGLSGKSKKDFEDGNAKFISYMNVYSNPAVNLNVDTFVKVSDNEKQNTIQYGDVLFTGSSETPNECGMSSVVTQNVEENIYVNSFCFGFRLNDVHIFNPDFLKHVFRSHNLRSQIFNTASGVTRFNVSKKRFGKIEIPIPPLAEQQRIVSILDKFEKLTTDLTHGIPAEIEARRKQYEYYRDKLLTFKRKAV